MLIGAQFGSDNPNSQLNAYQSVKHIRMLKYKKNQQKGEDKARVMNQWKKKITFICDMLHILIGNPPPPTKKLL